MADDSLSDLLTGKTDLSGVSWTGATGVDWSTLGRGIAGSIAATVGIGATAYVQGIVTGVTSLLTGFREFIAGGTAQVEGLPLITRETDGLIQVVVSAPLSIVRGAWDVSVAEFGVLALPAALLLVLATFWIVSQVIDAAREGL